MQPGSLLSGVMSSVTFDSANGWHSGIRSDVRLAAMMPAMRAVPSTSPFLALPDTISASVALLMTTRPSATATRSVAGLADTSTIRASPFVWLGGRAGSSLEELRAIALACAGRAWRIAARQQRAGRRRDIGLPHQAFADQKRRHAQPRQPRQIGGCKDAACADHQAVARDQRRQRLAGRKRG